MKLKLPERETIGPPQCPLFYRWTLWAPKVRGNTPFKVLLHHFAPNRQDADVPHDHPRSFVTFVLRGGYDDLVPNSDGSLRVGDRLSAPTVRFRRAEHAHMTRTDDRGAWTLVIMGPDRRPWGFWLRGNWWWVKDFERVFGFAWRCADPDEGIK